MDFIRPLTAEFETGHAFAEGNEERLLIRAPEGSEEQLLIRE